MVNMNYDPKMMSRQVMYGRYQDITNADWKQQQQATMVAETYKVEGRETKGIKQAMLASNHFTTGESSLQHYNLEAAPKVVDLVIGNLPEHYKAENLKRVSGSKHVIGATVEEDNFRGICKGTGRIQIRLNNGESSDLVKLNFLKQGFSVRDFEQDLRKKPIVTGLPKE